MKVVRFFAVDVASTSDPFNRPCMPNATAMQESFLHYIWQFQYFDKKALVTTGGERLDIKRPGLHNTDAGPDFSNAKIRIGSMSWAGSVEIHIHSSEWMEHRHHVDPAYESVVLHVVWDDDRPVRMSDGSLLPTVELRGRVDPQMVKRYRTLLESSNTIPCARSLARVPKATFVSMIDRVMMSRLESKSQDVLELLATNKNDWEETTYQVLARNFGFRVNAQPFFQLARGLPYKILARHADHPRQVEALLFGQAGFLDEAFKESYHRLLRREYKLLAAKYKLAAKLKPSQWKFLRMRPANFPTIRLAQFASLLCRQKNLFSSMLELKEFGDAAAFMDVEIADFWHSHYTFRSVSRVGSTGLGATSTENIIINSVVPMISAYGLYCGDPTYVDRAQRLLEDVMPEDNRILRTWRELGVEVKNGFDSQALIQLFNSYCTPRRCLQCAIGVSLLKPSS